MAALDEKQNITLRLSKQTIQKARVLAAQRLPQSAVSLPARLSSLRRRKTITNAP